MNKSTKNNQTASDRVSKKEKLTLLQGALATELTSEEYQSSNPLNLSKEQKLIIFQEFDKLESVIIPKLEYILEAQLSMILEISEDRLNESVQSGMNIVIDELMDELKGQVRKTRSKVI